MRADTFARVNAAYGLEPRRARRKIARAWAKQDWRKRAAQLTVSCGILALTSLGIFALPARAQGSRKDDVIFNAQGRPMAGATVRVCTSSATGQPCSPLANIYSDNALTQALANPTTTDGLGNYSFYAAPGRYMIEVSGPSITTKQIANVILPNDPSSPTFTTITTTTGINAFSLALTGNLTVAGSAAVTGSLTVNGALAIAGGLTFAGPKPWVDNSTQGALNNGSTDDATANIAAINGLAANGGSVIIGNNSLWTPPTAAWTAPAYYENVALGGRMIVKTNPFDLRALQTLSCALPMLQSGNVNFGWGPGCDIVPATAGTPSPVLSTNIISGGYGPNSIKDVRIGGFSGVGLRSCTIDLHLVNFFSVAATSAGLPFENCPAAGQFGLYVDDGGFETASGSTNPSVMLHTTGIGVFNRTFLSGNGILDETTSEPSAGPNCGQRLYNTMLYENAPAGSVPNAAFHTYDLTGCTFVGETYIEPQMSDAADAITPLIDLKRASGTDQLKDTVIINASPSGAWFRAPADRTTYQTGATLLGGVNYNVLGLYGANSYWNLLNSRGAIFARGDFLPSGVAVSATGVGLAGPYQLVCTPSNSGGSLAAGTYWVVAAYEDTETSPLEGQVSDEAGPLTTTGSSGSISCVWNQSVAPSAAIAATRLFTGTGQGQESVRYRSTSVGGPYVITGSGGTSAVPAQMFPNPGNAALTTKWGNGGDYTGTENCTAIGKQGCTGGDATPGDVQIAGKLAVSGGLSTAFSTKSSAYTLTASDAWINVTGTTTVTVPHALAGQRWDVFNSGSSTVTVQADSGNVNGAANITLAANTGKSVLCDGTNCFAH